MTARTELAGFLTRLREDAGRTLAELADHTRHGLEDASVKTVSLSTLRRAADPTRPAPKEPTVVAYVRACDAGTHEEAFALHLWRKARIEERGILPRLQSPAVVNIRTRADLAAALAAAYEQAGAPPLDALVHRAGDGSLRGATLLPRTTAWRITKRAQRDLTWEQCAAFLRACGTTGRRDLRAWKDAWTRVAHHTDPYAPLVLDVVDVGVRRDQQVPHCLQSKRNSVPQENQAHTALTAAGLQQLRQALARRDGMGPGPGPDVLLRRSDGTVAVAEVKRSGQRRPPQGPSSRPLRPRGPVHPPAAAGAKLRHRQPSQA